MKLSRRSLLPEPRACADAEAGEGKGPRSRRCIGKRVIEVNGKPATRYGVFQPSGAWGLTLDEGDTFDVSLENGLDVPSSVHWHGLDPPWRQDGVPYISAPPIAPGKFADYSFPAVPPGTRWMHSHFGLQEQNLLAAPLIVRETERDQERPAGNRGLVRGLLLEKARLLFEELRKPKPMNMTGGMTMSGATDVPWPDLNDVTYDAFLANDRTLADPQIFDVEKAARSGCASSMARLRPTS